MKKKSSGLNFMTDHGFSMTGHASRQKLTVLICMTGHAKHDRSCFQAKIPKSSKNLISSRRFPETPKTKLYTIIYKQPMLFRHR